MTTELTVIIAAWNAEDTVERCIQSALQQAAVSLEVLVADDRSTDNTSAIVSRLASNNSRVRLLYGGENGGPSVARNRAIAAARGTWLAILDADDYVEPQRGRTLIDFATKKRADIVFDNLCVVRESAETVGEGQSLFLDGQAFTNAQQWGLREFIAGNSGNCSVASLGYLKPILRRDFLQAAGLRYDETLRNSEDYMLIAECMANGAKTWFYPESFYTYRVAAGSISHRTTPAMLDALLSAEDRFLERYGANLPRDLVNLLKRRRSLISKLRTTEVALRAAKRGDLFSALRALAEHPSSADRVARHLGEAATKRLWRLTGHGRSSGN